MFSDSDSEENQHTLTINEHYAKAFEHKKEREELTKLKEKYGSDYSESGGSDEEDSEDTEEDSDGEELTPAVDAAILRTLARIRKKDPAIYEGDRPVFEEEHTLTQDKAPARKPKTKKKSKPLTIREAALASALADGTSDSRSSTPEPRPLTHTEEQALLRSETRAAFHGAVEPQTQDEDDLLIPRTRTRDEVELEEEEYRAFLEREVGEDLQDFVTIDTNRVIGTSEDVNLIESGNKQKKGKKERKKEKAQEKDESQNNNSVKKRDKKAKEEADQEFLMNYIFNRGWIDQSNRRLPTYNEIIESSSKPSKHKSTKSRENSRSSDGEDHNPIDKQREVHDATFSDEESFDDLAEAFETSYNFRFEEPGGALITSFPRIVLSARRESATRKDARARKKERQAAEKQGLLETRREEIRRERALAEVAVAAEEMNEGDTTVVGQDISSNKKSKKQERREELARLKALKAKELRRKLEMVSSEGGLESIDDEALAHLDLDADWDPSRHDAQMAKLYDDDGIAIDEDAGKPVWDDDINIDDIEPPTDAKSKAELKKQKKKDKKKFKKTDEDVGVDADEMDADLATGAHWDDWDDDGGEWKGTEEERKRKVDMYMEEVVNRLGFSGITSHMPTRFHYTTTTPEDYGLKPVEILLATDAELNSYVGLRKLAPYRVEKDGKAKKSWDPKRAERLKEFRKSLHSHVGSRYEDAWSLDAGMSGEKKKRKGKKERTKLRATQARGNEEENSANDAGAQQDPVAADSPPKRKRDSDSRPKEEKDGTQKKKRKRRHKKQFSGETDANERAR